MSRDQVPAEAVVVEVTRRGKLVVGEPFFTAGTPLLLDPKGLGEAGPGDLVVVRRSRGRARVERALGPADRIENVLEALLVETGARQDFEPYSRPAVTIEGRVDLRELPTFTIDPETAKDFDDALSIDDERAYVHIADVSYFVTAGSPLDYGAAERGFSTYVPGLVAPMLPHDLADDLCSLRPHVDRLCVTVELPLDSADSNASEPSFYRSVIRSDARLSYGQAQRILAGAEAFPLADVLRRLDERARELRRRRFARGALRIQTPEVAFEFDGNGGVAHAQRESEPEAHALVEEFMIRANEAVAELLSSRNRTALYRVHERPDPQSVLLLLAKLAELEVPTPPAPAELAEHVSVREREAAQIEYQADEICLAWLLDAVLFEQGWEAEFAGEIVGVIGSGLFVRFEEVFEAFLPARRLPGDYFEASPLGTALTGRRGGGAFRLGDPISVRVERIERTSGRVEVSPV